MTRTNAGFMWGFVIIIAALLQISFTFWDSQNTATKTAINFSKAYFLLEPKMKDYMCSSLSSNIVDEYISNKSEEISNLGLINKTVRRSLEHIETEFVYQSCDSAKVRLKASSRVYINPLFAWTAKLFDIGRVYHVDEILDLVKSEGNYWKVIGVPFDLCYTD